MKKRAITLLLALVMAVAFAAPAFALDLGDSLTKEELGALGFDPMYVQEGGAFIFGDLLNWDGTIEEDVIVYFRPNTKLYVDEDGILYRFTPVWSDTGIKYQLTFIGTLDEDMNIGARRIDMAMYRGSPTWEEPQG